MAEHKPYVPWSVREAGNTEGWHVLHEGLPPHLEPMVETWASRQMYDRALTGSVQRLLQLDLGGESVTPPNILMSARTTYGESGAWNVVDALLNVMGGQCETLEGRRHRGLSREEADALLDMLKSRLALEKALIEGSSAYTVIGSSPWRLTRRVDQTAQAAADDAIARAADASHLLKEAWQAAFKRDPDPDLAFGKAVLAVESVACALFSPNDKEPTLGKARNHLRATVDKWTVAGLDDKQQASGETLLAMVSTVWENHQRHVGPGGTRPIGTTQDEAEAVLFLAVTLVQWFERGFVRKPGA